MIGPDAFTFRALWRCYRNCRRNKRNTVNALAFELDAEANLLDLQQALCSRSDRPGRSICFITNGVKPCEVFAADFRDRVAHYLLVSYQDRLFEPIFIHDARPMRFSFPFIDWRCCVQPRAGSLSGEQIGDPL